MAVDDTCDSGPVRKVQALGATVSPDQLPEVHQALTRVCDCFGLRKDLRVVVVASGEANALSLRFARKRVVVLLSELLEGVIDDPDALAALLAHEICHSVMDHGIRGFFEVCKSAAYKAARELTCDNAGYLVTRNAAAVKTWLKICCAGKHLHSRLSEPSLIAESLQIERGVTGWLVRSHLSYPPVGKRLRNIDEFASLWEGTGFSPT